MSTRNRRLIATAGLLLSLAGCSESREQRLAKYRDLETPTQLLESVEAQQRGRQLYLRHCALCHGEAANGKGVRRTLSSRPVDFTDPWWRAAATPEQVFISIREGVRGTAMAGWRVFDEAQTWELVAYLLSVAEEPPNAGAAGE